MSNSDSWHSLSSSSYEEEEEEDIKDSTKNDNKKIDNDDNDDDEITQNDVEENQETVNIFKGENFRKTFIIQDYKDSLLLFAKLNNASSLTNVKCMMQLFYDDLSKYDKEFIDDLSHRLNIITYLHHPSISQIIGYSLSDFNSEPRLMLLYDFNLSESLEKKSKKVNFLTIPIN